MVRRQLLGEQELIDEDSSVEKLSLFSRIQQSNRQGTSKGQTLDLSGKSVQDPNAAAPMDAPLSGRRGFITASPLMGSRPPSAFPSAHPSAPHTPRDASGAPEARRMLVIEVRVDLARLEMPLEVLRGITSRHTNPLMLPGAC